MSHAASVKTDWMTPRYFLCLGILVSLLCLGLYQTYNSTNVRSRLALMANTCRNLPRDFTLELGPYKAWTMDWSQTPEGKYYSNKAPGPMVVAFPVYCFFQALLVPKDQNSSEDLMRSEWGQIFFFDAFLSVIFQVFPFLGSLFYLLKVGQKNYQKKSSARSWTLMASFLGTTATIFLGNYFGHAFSAWLFVLALALALDRRFVLLGFTLGFSFLSDYAAIFAFPAYFYLVFWLAPSKQKTMAFFKLFVGALPVALVFAAYHQAAFGSPFYLPQKFQNPIFVDLKNESEALWGVLHFSPKFDVLLKLLFGKERGILWTQPWLLIVCVLTFLNFKKVKEVRWSLWFCLLALGGFLILNSSFGNWHGGHTTGPRYLSPILPVFGILVLFLWDSLSRVEKVFLSASILYSVGFQFAALSATIVAVNGVSLFEFLGWVIRDNLAHVLLRFTVLCGAFILWCLGFHPGLTYRHFFKLIR